MKKQTKNKIMIMILSVIGLIAVTLLIRTGVIDMYTAQILTFSAINIIIALSLNLISGFTGQLALGHAGFMSIGAYTAAIVMMRSGLPINQFWPIIIAVIAGGLMAALFGFFIGFPTLRLRGDYLAIVTLGFGEIIRVILINMEGLTGGASGLKGIPSFTNDILWEPAVSFLCVTTVLVLTIVLIHNLIHSSQGRAIISIREDEIASNAMGINVFRYKMFSFTLSAFIAGVGGALYAPLFGYLNPSNFDFIASVNFLIIVVFGGMGSIVGTVVSGYILTYLREVLLSFLKDYRLVIFPVILIVIMLLNNMEIKWVSKLKNMWRLSIKHVHKKIMG
ncbi:MAG TPA: branched-chain amino acid ABC transporter permease [Bacillota bacterium]|nr:branched-chain amino acid ABC transporter permease [Bacillota bacterium]